MYWISARDDGVMMSRDEIDEGIGESVGMVAGMGAGEKELHSARMCVSEIMGRSVNERRRAQIPWMVAEVAMLFL